MQYLHYLFIKLLDNKYIYELHFLERFLYFKKY